MSSVKLSTAVPLGTGDDKKEQARLENEAYKLEYVHKKGMLAFVMRPLTQT